MEKLKGGLADGKTIEDVARKHSQFVGTMKLSLEKGMKVEREHSKDNKTKEEIAMDHLWEDPEYYEKLEKMEKKGKKETKEQTMADASGSFEAPAFGDVIQKRKLQEMIRQVREQMDAGVSAGAMYDAPIGTAGPSSPMDHTKKKRKDPLALDEKTKSASITAASTKDMISTKKGFPRFGGPKAKFVEINPKCKDPLSKCNQGADSDGAWKAPQNIKLKEAIERAAKKYGLTVEEVKKMVMKEGYALPNSIDFKPALTWGKDKGEKLIYHLTTGPLDITTKDEIQFAKLKMALQMFDVKFDEDKRPFSAEDEISPKVDTTPEDEDDDTDWGDNEDDNIFNNIK